MMFQKGRIQSVAFATCLIVFCVGLLPAHLLSQDPKTELFKEANTARDNANSVEAQIFSPDFFKTAVKSYEKAEEGFRKGKNLEDIEKDLKMSAVYYLKAVENTRIAHEELKNCIKARTDAIKVDAPKYRPEAWKDAEAEFTRAVKSLEESEQSSAENKARKAERQYRQVELESIKAGFLDGTTALIQSGKKSDVRKNAPATLTKAEELVAESENMLVENRYDTDQVRELAKEANYEAKHASYLSERIKGLEDSKTTLEQILLEAEQPIQTIADKLDVKAQFDMGTKPVLDDVLHQVWVLQQTIATLKQDVSDGEAQISMLTDEIKTMQSQLGDLKDKEQSLAKLMEQQRLQREKYARVEKAFTQDEAQVSRIEDKVIIRMYGLSFPVGKSTIEPQYYGLLAKVIEAFREYPGCNITVEGHTDSYGTDDKNQQLSTERSEAVKQYLLATSGMDAARITAVGYGESKPIASNETKDGRRRNRRIEVVIHPKE